MALNFCLPQYSPEISCNQLSADDFEVSNLISADSLRLKRGFRAEHFIKPPIEIILQFPYPVEISHIILGLKSGAQQTSAVKLFSGTPPIKRKSKLWSSKFIGKCENITCRKLCFHNSRYVPRHPFTRSLSNPRAFEENGVVKVALKNDITIFVSCVQKLRICLERVANSGVAVLSELQVWGQPSAICDRSLIEKICSIGQSPPCLVPKASVDETHDDTQTVAVDEGGGDSGTNEDCDIPSDFLDSITHEIMTLPMVLPSGNTVDQQTVEKCNRAQEIYGRSAVDPFTGIPYHGENQPVFNAALKARIDQFLVRKGPSLNAPRSTGTRENIPRKMYKSLLYSSTSKSTKGTFDTNLQSTLENQVDSKTSALKRTLVLEKDNVNKKKRPTLGIQLESGSTVNSPSSSLCEALPLEMVCEKKRKESLKAALQDVLGATRRFTNFSKAANPQVIRCVVCDCEFADSIFQLPCMHIMCRSCMISRLKTVATSTCITCNVAFSSDTVERVFL